MNKIIIPNYKTLIVTNIVLDYNGTIAKDGLLKEEVKPLLEKLTKEYLVHVITADTFGSVQAQLKEYDVSVKILNTDNHTLEKAAFVQSLNAENTVAIGNGNNDAMMIKNAVIGIALLGDEGCSSKTLLESDITCKSIKDALELFLNTKRLIATLRS
ncbi:MAG: haloacid dehalogenase [Sulfurimonas sp.]